MILSSNFVSACTSRGPGTNNPTSYSVENYPLSNLLEIAYRISSYQLVGPAWLDEERFTVNSKVPPGATKDELKLMMQNLLIGRFRLAAHFEKREVAGYQMVVVKGGPKLAASPGDPTLTDDPDKKPAPFKLTFDKDGYPELPPGRNYSMALAKDRARWRFGDETMDDLYARCRRHTDSRYPCSYMDILRMLDDLREEREQIEQAIVVVERLATGRGKRRGRPPAWMAAMGDAPKRLGRPPGSKNKSREETAA